MVLLTREHPESQMWNNKNKLCLEIAESIPKIAIGIQVILANGKFEDA